MKNQYSNLSARKVTACFSGYRPLKIFRTLNGYNTDEALQVIKGRIRAIVLYHISKGYNTFIIGMADGFDILAGSCLVELKSVHSQLKVTAAVPFPGHKSYTQQSLYENVLKGCNSIIYTSQE